MSASGNAIARSECAIGQSGRYVTECSGLLIGLKDGLPDCTTVEQSVNIAGLKGLIVQLDPANKQKWFVDAPCDGLFKFNRSWWLIRNRTVSAAWGVSDNNPQVDNGSWLYGDVEELTAAIWASLPYGSTHPSWNDHQGHEYMYSRLTLEGTKMAFANKIKSLGGVSIRIDSDYQLYPNRPNVSVTGYSQHTLHLQKVGAFETIGELSIQYGKDILLVKKEDRVLFFFGPSDTVDVSKLTIVGDVECLKVYQGVCEMITLNRSESNNHIVGYKGAVYYQISFRNDKGRDNYELVHLGNFSASYSLPKYLENIGVPPQPTPVCVDCYGTKYKFYCKEDKVCLKNSRLWPAHVDSSGVDACFDTKSDPSRNFTLSKCQDNWFVYSTEWDLSKHPIVAKKKTVHYIVGSCVLVSRIEKGKYRWQRCRLFKQGQYNLVSGTFLYRKLSFFSSSVLPIGVVVGTVRKNGIRYGILSSPFDDFGQGRSCPGEWRCVSLDYQNNNAPFDDYRVTTCYQDILCDGLVKTCFADCGKLVHTVIESDFGYIQDWTPSITITKVENIPTSIEAGSSCIVSFSSLNRLKQVVEWAKGLKTSSVKAITDNVGIIDMSWGPLMVILKPGEDDFIINHVVTAVASIAGRSINTCYFATDHGFMASIQQADIERNLADMELPKDFKAIFITGGREVLQPAQLSERGEYCVSDINFSHAKSHIPLVMDTIWNVAHLESTMHRCMCNAHKNLQVRLNYPEFILRFLEHCRYDEAGVQALQFDQLDQAGDNNKSRWLAECKTAAASKCNGKNSTSLWPITNSIYYNVGKITGRPMSNPTNDLCYVVRPHIHQTEDIWTAISYYVSLQSSTSAMRIIWEHHKPYYQHHLKGYFPEPVPFSVVSDVLPVPWAEKPDLKLINIKKLLEWKNCTSRPQIRVSPRFYSTRESVGMVIALASENVPLSNIANNFTIGYARATEDGYSLLETLLNNLVARKRFVFTIQGLQRIDVERMKLNWVLCCQSMICVTDVEGLVELDERFRHMDDSMGKNPFYDVADLNPTQRSQLRNFTDKEGQIRPNHLTGTHLVRYGASVVDMGATNLFKEAGIGLLRTYGHIGSFSAWRGSLVTSDHNVKGNKIVILRR